MESTTRQSVFFYELVPVEGRSLGELELRLRELSGSLTLAARPRISASLLSHRILRRGGGCAWEIGFSGLDLPEAEVAVPADSIGKALLAEVRERLRGFAEIVFAGEYEDVSPAAPWSTVDATHDASILSFGNGEAACWEDYASGARSELAGAELSGEITAAIRQARAALPAEPGLRPWGKGHMYSGASDKPHLAYLTTYLAARAERATPAERRKILAFHALQGREGSTAAINTYDNQIVTWGTGWGGRGWLGKVVERALRSPAVRDLFGRCGVRYRGGNEYDVVDVERRRVVSGRAPALGVIRSSVGLLNMLIHAARDLGTRDAVTEAQLEAFMTGSANLQGAEAIATQALFNFVAHLKHWAPAYVDGLDRVILQAADGPPSEERDRRIAVLAARHFYARARRAGWLPDWQQFRTYWEDMKDDGLDCMEEPIIKAPRPPGEEGALGLPSVGGGQAPAGGAEALKNRPLAGNTELDAVLRGGTGLRRGARGSGVERLQEALATLGLEVSGGVDGIFGGGTEAAVMKFQEKLGLDVDGVVGDATLRGLDDALSGCASGDP